MGRANLCEQHKSWTSTNKTTILHTNPYPTLILGHRTSYLNTGRFFFSTLSTEPILRLLSTFSSTICTSRALLMIQNSGKLLRLFSSPEDWWCFGNADGV